MPKLPGRTRGLSFVGRRSRGAGLSTEGGFINRDGLKGALYEQRALYSTRAVLERGRSKTAGRFTKQGGLKSALYSTRSVMEMETARALSRDLDHY